MKDRLKVLNTIKHILDEQKDKIKTLIIESIPSRIKSYEKLMEYMKYYTLTKHLPNQLIYKKIN